MSTFVVHCRRLSRLLDSPRILSSAGQFLRLAGRRTKLERGITAFGHCGRIRNRVTSARRVLSRGLSRSVTTVTGRRLDSLGGRGARLRRHVGILLLPDSPGSSGGVVVRVQKTTKKSRTTLFTNALFAVCDGFTRDRK